jgi:hypothetical protein
MSAHALGSDIAAAGTSEGSFTDTLPAPPALASAAAANDKEDDDKARIKSQAEQMRRLAYEAEGRAEALEQAARDFYARDRDGRPLYRPRVSHARLPHQRGMSQQARKPMHYAQTARDEMKLEALRKEQQQKDEAAHQLARQVRARAARVCVRVAA